MQGEERDLPKVPGSDERTERPHLSQAAEMEVPKVCEGSDAAAEVTAFPRWWLHPLWVTSWSGEEATDIAGYRSGGARRHYCLIGGHSAVWRRRGQVDPSEVSSALVAHL